MIAYLKGTVQWKDETSLILFHPPTGYEVFTPEVVLSTLNQGQVVELFIHTHMTEDAIRLYGFSTIEERDAFRKIIAVSGVGPKIGLAILSTLSLDDLVQCIETRNVDQFKRIPGIGAKKAEKILLELEGKLERSAIAARHTRAGSRRLPLEIDLQQALVQLGYRPSEFHGVLAELKRQFGVELETMTVSSVLPRALQWLSSGRGVERGF